MEEEMKEPIWEEVYEAHPEFEGRTVGKGDLVYVTGKTRGRFGALDIAKPGAYGLVISRWTSSMGTSKISILQEDGTEAATTGSCVRVWGSFQTTGARDEKWYDIWLRWMDETYVPIIVQREKGYKRPWATSRDGKSVLVKPLASTTRAGKVWLSVDKVHPDDWQSLSSERPDPCVSVRVPVWLAKKAGVFGNV
jgi:hypothetical protein